MIIVFFGVIILFIAIGNLIKINLGKKNHNDINYYFNKDDDNLFKDDKVSTDTFTDPAYSSVLGNVFHDDSE